MYVPEALAATVYLNMHLADTMGDPTAMQLGLMPLFKQTTAFYKMPAHAALYHNATDLPGRVTCIRSEYRRQPDAVERWAHGGAPDQSQLFTGISGAGWSACQLSRCQISQERDACILGPDYGADTPVAFTYSGGQVQVTVPKLVAYVAIVSGY